MAPIGTKETHNYGITLLGNAQRLRVLIRRKVITSPPFVLELFKHLGNIVTVHKSELLKQGITQWLC
jgi:hypothetical protein